MDEEWRCQLRVYLSDDLAEMARSGGHDSVLDPLRQVLAKHEAILLSQYDAFEAYVHQAEAEGPEGFPLYRWTKAVIDDPTKRGQHVRAFAVRVGGQEVYPRRQADALEADLQPLVGGSVVERLSRHDTNPANNMPVPAAYRS